MAASNKLDPMKLEMLKKTYCNPLSLPDYPRGRHTYDKPAWGWLRKDKPDFRESADPSVLYHEGKWYLYPSCGMAFVTEDFVTWKHHRTEPYDPGYAPTIVLFRDRFYLTACEAPLFVSDNPLGPFESIGMMLKPDGTPLEHWLDPMLFADDDGQLYAYWGIGSHVHPGIHGARLDPDRPNCLLTEPRTLFEFNREHRWEWYGDFNEDASKSFTEGPWMLKHNGTYYLTYAAPGTQYKTYGMGSYISDKPLGPFAYQKRNPILRNTEGLVHGPGHGCIVHGPNDTLWAFYTCLVHNLYVFERRCGMDPAGFDDEGNLFVLGSSETPQWAPGLADRPELGNDTGLLPVNVNKIARASSEMPGREAAYAIDNIIRTWWQAATDDPEPSLEVDLYDGSIFTVCAVRIMWAEPGLNYEKGVLPGPFRYKLEATEDWRTWKTALDRTDNETDLLIDYQVFKPVKATGLRLTVTGHPEGIGVGVIEMTVFGKSEPSGGYGGTGALQ